jgi:hypothetical protein
VDTYPGITRLAVINHSVAAAIHARAIYIF